MYHVYILQSQKDSGFYTGLTKDLSRRLREHNGGNVQTTKARHPFVLLYSEKYTTRNEARAREIFLKTGEGREFRNSVVQRQHIPR